MKSAWPPKLSMPRLNKKLQKPAPSGAETLTICAVGFFSRIASDWATPRAITSGCGSRQRELRGRGWTSFTTWSGHENGGMPILRGRRSLPALQRRVELESLFLIGLGLFPVTPLGMGQATAVIGQGEIRVEMNRLGVIVDGLVETI